MSDPAIVKEKSGQVHEVLRSHGIDLWITFCRETDHNPEPCLPFILGFDVVWPTLVAYTRTGDSYVVLGRHDAPNARELGIHEVRPYDESLAEPVHDLLESVDPDEIAINYSIDDPTADGLSHGMYRRLVDLLEGTEYADRLMSAEDVVAELRGIKSPTERERIRYAAETSAELLASMASEWTPDWTERDVSAWLHDRMADQGIGAAWAHDYCPTVHHGSDAEIGHTLPDDRTLPEGEVLHVDFGVTKEGYAADMQRLYYHGDPADVPTELQTAFDDVRSAIEAGRAAIEPGAKGYEADQAARTHLTDRGWPAYQHALGHQVGRNAHDGGTLLGPRWQRYGTLPDRRIREGEIYTVELGIDTEWGYLGLEEMVEVTATGTQYVVPPQREFRSVGQ